jgi:hypothetical protein
MLYGINFFPITVLGREMIVMEYDGDSNFGPTFLPTAQPGMTRQFLPGMRLPPAYSGTMRQLTLDLVNNNLYWYQTSESGVLGATDSIWMSPAPYSTAILLEAFAYTSDAHGNPVISGDYVWFGCDRVHIEKLIGQ